MSSNYEVPLRNPTPGNPLPKFKPIKPVSRTMSVRPLEKNNDSYQIPPETMLQ